MDYKAFKQDLTYACKKFQKEGKLFTVDCDNLVIDADGKFVSDGDALNPLEMLVLIKGYTPTLGMNRAYNIYVSDVVEQQAQIPMSDIYAFYDGLENAYFEGSNEFYNVGVYIRDKFQPAGARKEMPSKTIFQSAASQTKSERLFVIYSFKGDTSIMEVECQRLTQTECPFPSMKEGEWAAKILKPQSLWDKLPSGKLVPSIWCGWAFYNSAEECREKFEASTRMSILRSKSKRKLKDPEIVVEVTEEEVTAVMDKVKTVYL